MHKISNLLNRSSAKSAVFGQKHFINISVRNARTVQENLKKANTFGNYSDLELATLRAKDDPEDMEKYPGLGNSLMEFESLLKNNKYNEAVSILRIIQKHQKAPINAYRVLLSYNALRGNVVENEHLFEDIKRRGYKISHPMYTSLFSSCSNCQNSNEALSFANKVLSYMKKINFSPNNIIYNSMLHAFGRHGDFRTVTNIFNEIVYIKKKPLTSSCNYIFDACYSNKGSGLIFTLIMWHMMLKKNIKPNNYTFQILLRCVRDCSLGEPELFSILLQEISGPNVQEKLSSRELETLNLSIDEENKHFSEVKSTEVEMENELLFSSCKSNEVELAHPVLPNLLHKIPNLREPFDWIRLSTSVDRFLLVGGLKGFLEVVSSFQIKADCKMFSLMLGCQPPTTEAEEELLNEMTKLNIKVDAAFLNVLLRRRLDRNEVKSIEDCINLFEGYKIPPDQITLGTIAPKCTTHESGNKCIALARKHSMRLNSFIVDPLLANACNIDDVCYVSDVVAAVKKDEVEVSNNFILHLRNFVKREKNK